MSERERTALHSDLSAVLGACPGRRAVLVLLEGEPPGGVAHVVLQEPDGVDAELDPRRAYHLGAQALYALSLYLHALTAQLAEDDAAALERAKEAASPG